MEKRIKFYLEYYRKLAEGETKIEDKESCISEMLIQIGFFQHERFIHLIVTVLFAIAAIISMLTMLFLTDLLQITVLVLFFAFMVLLVPYVRHYFILENGVQQLYKYYDAIRDKNI